MMSGADIRSKLSSHCAEEARQAVLSFFRAPEGYTVVFTANASAALKLVGEAFPFAEDSSYVLGADSHNSVHGIRQYAQQRGAQVYYIESTPTGGVEASDAKASQHYWCCDITYSSIFRVYWRPTDHNRAKLPLHCSLSPGNPMSRIRRTPCL